MVKVREDRLLIKSDGSVDLETWINGLSVEFKAEEKEQLIHACNLSYQAQKNSINTADKRWSAGCFLPGLEMVEILASLKVDHTTLLAAMLYRSIREEKLAIEIVIENFGQEVGNLIKGVLGMVVMTSLFNTSNDPSINRSQDQIEKVRKMLVSIIDDVRVALIKLAERACIIKCIKEADYVRQQKVAKEVFEIYAPLAHRLGIGYIKWELEDLSFRYLKPLEYRKIAEMLNEKRVNRDQYIGSVVDILKKAMKEANITVEIHGRVKHIYSIWRKMQRKGLSFRELYDIRAVRILTEKVQDCYAALGIVHSLWNHIPKEFDDYITTPKENGYRSLHTAVYGPQGKTLEVQIRTHKMHEEAELGVCAHWKYKGTDVKTNQDSYEEKLAWLRQVIEWQEDIGALNSGNEVCRSNIEADRIYVFTPEGEVVDLYRGATPIDFAYRIHTEVGNRCRGAKISGRIVPLTYQLKTGQQVEILTAKNGRPSRDWLNPELGYVNTPRARQKIINWFKKQDRQSHINDGKSILEGELKRLALQKIDMLKLAHALNLHSVEDLYAVLGSGDIKLAHVVTIAYKLLEPEEQKHYFPKLKTTIKKHGHSDINIAGVGNLLSHIANCCKPVPGDPIIGYITLGRGVTIHREDCNNALHLQDKEPERVIQVSWGEEPEHGYPVDISITAYDRYGLIKDITMVLANNKGNILSLDTKINKTDNIANILLTIEVPSVDFLGKILLKLYQLPNVMEAIRLIKYQ